MLRILHVSCAFGGGITTAVTAMARNYPSGEHHLLAFFPAGAFIPITEPSPFASVTKLESLAKTVSRLRQAYAELKPDVVHLHSSVAGGFGRLAFLPRRKVVYTPHCFAFEQTNKSQFERAAYAISEAICSFGAYTVAGVSPRECQLASRMPGRPYVAYLPNYPDLPSSVSSDQYIAGSSLPLAAVMVGRLLPQKDPPFFLEVKRCLDTLSADVRLKWIGGGSEVEEKKLRDAGIEVTGWTDHLSVLKHVANADIYVHCAAWEGLPMSVLEAAGLRRPIVSRDIPALRGIGISQLHKTPEEVACALIAVAADSQLLGKLAVESSELAQRFSAEFQRAALLEIYAYAGGMKASIDEKTLVGGLV